MAARGRRVHDDARRRCEPGHGKSGAADPVGKRDTGPCRHHTPGIERHRHQRRVRSHVQKIAVGILRGHRPALHDRAHGLIAERHGRDVHRIQIRHDDREKDRPAARQQVRRDVLFTGFGFGQAFGRRAVRPLDQELPARARVNNAAIRRKRRHSLREVRTRSAPD